ncbi:heme biosynthesis protein HemY [Hylemonella gracilis str. Niagara R]|uniref:Heme biosynthesis protein HemY n=1 Tax=Hylemonella gracilis str. Niagara R TaxID=1458275 RepID=A0A016XF99_9BURK|nr:heme biosynthesis HemY N-terminal domain-containing protein [Hylemonella gracilis]EYC50779.1 heme biosynthesis protein HemY [Hylemonella gracilis str. Niagara R]
MRSLVWLLFLFALAVGAALFLADNAGMVTVFWPPYRFDMSANFAALALLLAFVLLHAVLRGLAMLLDMPAQARRWRRKHQERAQQQGLLDAMAHWTAGRYLRGRKAAEIVIEQTRSLMRDEQALPLSIRIMALAHLLAAECAHALQDRARRDEHAQAAMEAVAGELAGSGDSVNRGAVRMRDAQEVREGVQLRMARWAYEDRDAQTALRRMDELPQGVARRLAALRLRLRVTRLAGKPLAALETVRLLSKHRAFSDTATQVIVRGLVSEVLRDAHDQTQLLQAWEALEPAERELPEAALQAGERMLALGEGTDKGGSAFTRVLRWLEPVWEQLVRPALPASAIASMSAASVVQGAATASALRLRLVLLLERGFDRMPPDAAWLGRIETAQMTNPGDPLLQYLAGVTCMRLSLWGKAQQLLKQSLTQLKDEGLRRRAWVALARLAEQREDPQAALEAWKQAALG